MDKKQALWIGFAALIATPALGQTSPPKPPEIKPAEPAKPAEKPPAPSLAKPAEKAPEPRKEAVAAQVMIDTALKKIDKTIKRETNVWQFELAKRQVIVITDPVAERMRIMVPIVEASKLDQELLTRLMQANFDSALDARYAIASDLLWGTFIHPLTSLDEKGFVSGLAQAIAVAENFGGSFSSGAIVFGGGDSTKLQEQELLELLREKAEADKKNVI